MDATRARRDVRRGRLVTSGEPLQLVVDGILEGRLLDEQVLRAAVKQLSRCGAGEFRADVEGGRFSLLPVETQVFGGAFGAAAQGDFLEALQQVVAAARPGSVESTLRCTVIHEREVVETLFAVRGARVEPLSRRRPKRDDDVVIAPPARAAAPFGLRRRELAWIAPVLLVLGALVAWQTGWVDRVLAARAEGLRIDQGPLGDLVAVDVERSWGEYRLRLTRGEGYPATPEALATRRDASPDLETRAAVELVGNGGSIFVQIADDQGKVIASTRVELRPLLGKADGVVEARLPGRIAAAAVVLSLNAESKPK
jgi:hypothetical protein